MSELAWRYSRFFSCGKMELIWKWVDVDDTERERRLSDHDCRTDSMAGVVQKQKSGDMCSETFSTEGAAFENANKASSSAKFPSWNMISLR